MLSSIDTVTLCHIYPSVHHNSALMEGGERLSYVLIEISMNRIELENLGIQIFM